MNIVIAGAGIVGESLAEQLSSEGHAVSVVDKDRARVRELGEKYDVLGVVGNAASPKVLQRAGIGSAEMMIAVTDADEVNIVVGMVASKLDVEHRIVRVRNHEYVGSGRVLSLKDIGIHHVINPDRAIVDALVRMIDIPGSTHIARLAGGQLLILGFSIEEDSPAVGMTLAELRDLAEITTFLVLDIVRGDKVLVPGGGDRLEPGDSVHLLVASDTVKLVPPLIQRDPPTVESVIICGASRIGVQLARTMRKKVERVTLIEPDRHEAEEAARTLKKVTVLHGEPTRLDVLDEAAFEGCDLFCAVSDDDQSNVLSALLAKRHSGAQTAVLVHHPDYVPVLHSLGVRTVVNPRLVTVGEILMHVRRGHIHSVTRLPQGRAEVLEMEVPQDSPVVRKRLRDLSFPSSALLGAIIRDGRMRIPTGNSQVEPGDLVVVFALPDAIPKIEKLFARRRWF